MISVVIPVYGVEKYLPQCLDRMLVQTVQDFEIILVDDGSKDNCGAICDAYAQKDPRIRVIHQPNGGLSRARNAGMAIARGEYLVLPDSDDWVEANYLETLLRNMTPGGLSVVDYVENDTPVSQETKAQRMTMAQAQASVCHHSGIQGFAWNKMFDMQVIRQAGLQFDPAVQIEDIPFVMAYCQQAGGSCVFSDAKAYHYRMVSGSLAHKRFYPQVSCTKKQAMEYESIQSVLPYLLDEEAQTAQFHRAIRGAGYDVRVMWSHGMTKDADYKRKLSLVRKHCFTFLRGPYGSRGAKLSMLLCALSPALEWKVWALRDTNSQ